ncbi:uncharacterized protein N7459_009055 [Penicillium hispanicum]|uniref:uncharacterized protein n=1 Tax=Penicillium hispanicum TaxID=1080232 RepID=UPI0025407F16|nr:uncharacterized protein N7459_009055 [Penicillium hispanicum]KAJ5569625.1 hypothetical protein N7459_009055 [Penicillium hispanicum]
MDTNNNYVGISTRMSGTVKALAPTAAKVSTDVAASPDDICLNKGENNIMKPKMVAVCKEAMDKGIAVEAFSNPSGFSGDQTLKEALAQYISTYFHPTIPITPSQVIPTAGSGNAVEALLFTLCDAGDSVLCPAPGWWGYSVYGLLHAGVNIIPAGITAPEKSWSTESLSSAIVPALEEAYHSAPAPGRIKALITSNPNNPFARCWSPAAVRDMMDFCHRYGLHYISDEVFANTLFDPQTDQFVSALSLLKGSETTESELASEEKNAPKSVIDPGSVHIIWSMTKDFGTCGVRSGCVATYNPLVRDGASYASLWQVSSLTAIFTASVLTSPLLPPLISSVKSELKKAHQMCHDILACDELAGRADVLSSTAGLWVNVIITLREEETIGDVIASARKCHVIIDSSGDFTRFLDKTQAQIKVTFSLEENILKEGLLRLKAALL